MIKERRLAANKSVEEVAEHLNMDLGEYKRYESIDKMPSIYDWCKLAEYIGFNPIPAYVVITYPIDLKDQLLQLITKRGEKTNDHQTDMQSVELINNCIAEMQEYSAKAMDTESLCLDSYDLSNIFTPISVAHIDLDIYGNYLIDRGIACVNKLLHY